MKPLKNNIQDYLYNKGLPSRWHNRINIGFCLARLPRDQKLIMFSKTNKLENIFHQMKCYFRYDF